MAWLTTLTSMGCGCRGEKISNQTNSINALFFFHSPTKKQNSYRANLDAALADLLAELEAIVDNALDIAHHALAKILEHRRASRQHNVLMVQELSRNESKER